MNAVNIKVVSGSYLPLPFRPTHNETKPLKLPIPAGEYTEKSLNSWTRPYIIERYGSAVQVHFKLAAICHETDVTADPGRACGCHCDVCGPPYIKP